MSITSEDIIFEAKFLLRLRDTTDHDADMDILIEESLRHLDNIDTFDYCNYVFEVTDNKIKLPKGFKRWGTLRFTELAASNPAAYISPIVIPQPFNQVLYVDFPFLTSCEITPQQLQQNGMIPYTTLCKIKGNYIVFNSNITSVYAQGELAYIGLAKDDNGRLLIKDDYTRAIKAYLCWKFSSAYPERYDRNQKQEWMEEWKAQKSWLKGEASKENANRNRWVITNIMRKIRVNTI